MVILMVRNHPKGRRHRPRCSTEFLERNPLDILTIFEILYPGQNKSKGIFSEVIKSTTNYKKSPAVGKNDFRAAGALTSVGHLGT